MTGRLKPCTKNVPSFQWNSEVSPASQPHHAKRQPKANTQVFDIIHASNLVSTGAADLQSLGKPPFDSFSIATLSSIRDNAYHQQVYNCAHSELAAAEADHFQKACTDTIDSILKRRLAHPLALHQSSFRRLVLLSILSPWSVIIALFRSLVDFPTPHTPQFVHGALLSLGTALSYRTSSDQSFLIAAIDQCLSVPMDLGSDLSQSPLCCLLTLLLNASAQDAFSGLSCESCIEQVVHPLVMKGQLNQAAIIMRVVSAYAKNHNVTLKETHSSCAAQIIRTVVELTSSDSSWSVLKDIDRRPTVNLYESITVLESYAKCLSRDHFIQLLHCAGPISWPAAYNLLQYITLPDDCMAAVKEELRLALSRLETGDNQTTAIEPYEAFLVLLATAPMFPPNFADSGLHTVKVARDCMITKWMAALIRQCPQLTAHELHRLFSDRLAFVLQACSPVNENEPNCPPWSFHLGALQLGLQATCGMLRYFPQPTLQKLYSDGAQLSCRTICAVLMALATEHHLVALDACAHSAVVQMLLRFLLGHFDEQGGDGEAVRAPCADVVTMTLLEILRHYGAKSCRQGDLTGVNELTAVIKGFDDASDNARRICSAALAALLQNVEQNAVRD